MFVRIFNFSHAGALPLFLTVFNMLRSTVGAYWKNGSFSECEINYAFVDTKLRGIKH